jgi:hypothetical protein
VQERYIAEFRRTLTVRGYEAMVVPGLFQTPEYAHHLLLHNAELMQSPRDTDYAVRSRMKRQEVLYKAHRSFRILVSEGALHALVYPHEVMAEQLDRLRELIGMSTIELGIVLFGVQLKPTPKHGFWFFDEERVIVETIATEFTLESGEDIALYEWVWDRLEEGADHGPQAHRLIARARAVPNLA